MEKHSHLTKSDDCFFMRMNRMPDVGISYKRLSLSQFLQTDPTESDGKYVISLVKKEGLYVRFIGI